MAIGGSLDHEHELAYLIASVILFLSGLFIGVSAVLSGISDKHSGKPELQIFYCTSCGRLLRWAKAPGRCARCRSFKHEAIETDDP